MVGYICPVIVRFGDGFIDCAGAEAGVIDVVYDRRRILDRSPAVVGDVVVGLDCCLTG